MKEINETPMTSAFTISSFIIKVYSERQNEIAEDKKLDLLKLLKLLYFSFGFISVEQKQWIFSERIEAWELGPVVPDIYYHARHYTDDEYKINPFVVSDKIDSKIDIKKLPEKIETIYKGVESITMESFKLRASDMVNMTHAKDGPWDIFYDGTPSKEIPKKAIILYYQYLFEKSKEKSKKVR